MTDRRGVLSSPPSRRTLVGCALGGSLPVLVAALGCLGFLTFCCGWSNVADATSYVVHRGRTHCEGDTLVRYGRNFLASHLVNREPCASREMQCVEEGGDAFCSAGQCSVGDAVRTEDGLVGVACDGDTLVSCRRIARGRPTLQRTRCFPGDTCVAAHGLADCMPDAERVPCFPERQHCEGAERVVCERVPYENVFLRSETARETCARGCREENDEALCVAE